MKDAVKVSLAIKLLREVADNRQYLDRRNVEFRGLANKAAVLREALWESSATEEAIVEAYAIELPQGH